MRHVKLKPGLALDTAALCNLVDAAYLDIRARLRGERIRNKGDAADR
jgi:hypothetical protein